MLFVCSNIGKVDDYTPLYITQLDKFTAEVQDFPYQGDKEVPVVRNFHPLDVQNVKRKLEKIWIK